MVNTYTEAPRSAAQAPQPSCIDREIERISQSSTAIRNSIATLYEKLKPVLLQDAPTEEPEKSDKDEIDSPRCPLHDDLIRLRKKAQADARVLYLLLERIAL